MSDPVEAAWEALDPDPYEVCECGHTESHHGWTWTCLRCGHGAESAGTGLDVEALRIAICYVAGQWIDHENAVAIAPIIAAQYARLSSSDTER